MKIDKLRNEIIKEGLKNLSRTYDNVSFAYVYLDIAGKEIERLHSVLKYYPHVRYLTMNENKIKSLDGIAGMHSLLYLDASQNELRNADFLSANQCLSYLQEVSIANNKVKQLHKVVLPRLRRANLDENKLRSAEAFSGHRQLEVLRLNKNKIKTLAGLSDIPRLRELHLGENKIKTWESLTGLPSLQVLDLRANLLKEIPEQLPSWPRLTDLNLSGNKLARLGEVVRLQQLPSLQSLSVEGNPMEEEAGGDLRRAVIVKFCVQQSADVIEYRRLLVKVNDAEFAADERQSLLDELIAAAEDEKRRKEEEERERKEREEEELRVKQEEERQRLEEEERQRLEDEEKHKLEEQERLEQQVKDGTNVGDGKADDADGGNNQEGVEEQHPGDGDAYD